LNKNKLMRRFLYPSGLIISIPTWFAAINPDSQASCYLILISLGIITTTIQIIIEIYMRKKTWQEPEEKVKTKSLVTKEKFHFINFTRSFAINILMISLIAILNEQVFMKINEILTTQQWMIHGIPTLRLYSSAFHGLLTGLVVAFAMLKLINEKIENKKKRIISLFACDAGYITCIGVIILVLRSFDQLALFPISVFLLFNIIAFSFMYFIGTAGREKNVRSKKKIKSR
ncbi:MAG: hypothetical protein ACTSXU_14985, partial [Promethearchaeota archaeon]